MITGKDLAYWLAIFVALGVGLMSGYAIRANAQEIIAAPQTEAPECFPYCGEAPRPTVKEATRARTDFDTNHSSVQAR